MIGIVSRSFSEMVEMGMCLEEGVRQGRLTREDAPSNHAKKFDNGYPRKEEQEVGIFAYGGFKSGYPDYPYIAAVSITPQQPFNQPVRTQKKAIIRPYTNDVRRLASCPT
jgi:hypothetical protein